MKNERGFTLVELIVVAWFFLLTAVVVGGIYVLCHFVGKFW